MFVALAFALHSPWGSTAFVDACSPLLQTIPRGDRLVSFLRSNQTPFILHSRLLRRCLRIYTMSPPHVPSPRQQQANNLVGGRPARSIRGVIVKRRPSLRRTLTADQKGQRWAGSFAVRVSLCVEGCEKLKCSYDNILQHGANPYQVGIPWLHASIL